MSDEIRINRYGTPFLFSMIHILEANYPSEYYGYINSDILVSETLPDVLHQISRMRKEGILNNKV